MGTMDGHASDKPIKQPNVAGQFYTADPDKLSAQIESFLDSVPPAEKDVHVEMIISPHAGYIYSGRVAAHAFKQVQDKHYSTVIVMAPSHRYGFTGLSVWKEGGYKTPLGTLKVDEDIAARIIAADPRFIYEPRAFEAEHALEVELPFIQETLSGVKIVPIIMGQCDPAACRKAAETINGIMSDRDDILVVISSDMSHFHDAAAAEKMDAETLSLIKEHRTEEFWQRCAARELEMCGFVPVTTALYLAELRDLDIKVLKYAHSGDVTGDNSNVVGYSAIMFSRGEGAAPGGSAESFEHNPGGVDRLSAEQKKELIHVARQTVESYVRDKEKPEFDISDERLSREEGAFVTLHKDGQLRGCIGNIIGRQPLHKTVRDMAVAAASQDPRFPPVKPAELKDIDVEISVLSVPRPSQNPEEIVMGRHGVIVKKGFKQGVFLPQVATETGWSREEFLSHLCAQKAGLAPDAWKDPDTELYIFTATVFSEGGTD